MRCHLSHTTLTALGVIFGFGALICWFFVFGFLVQKHKHHDSIPAPSQPGGPPPVCSTTITITTTIFTATVTTTVVDADDDESTTTPVSPSLSAFSSSPTKPWPV
ncbi:hypothetical protein B0T20DRAFT_388326 [Sordaria brevicollis]|uniref:Uncharacterized protein n=1 Tax=Sordaria brevicollis TaxID=83679 RepID=A0AAE0PMK8_SORBR|nr:hypothetical protein B0T20DRAFT_388326 [Sordaria brevicollis]